MNNWREDPRLPYVLAAILGMIAGVAAKQAVMIQTGVYPKPVSILADFLILGVVFLLSMYAHSVRPSIPVEGIALLSAALAMWGPRGIALLLSRFKKSALAAAEEAANSFIDPVEPIHRPVVPEAVEREKEAAMNPMTENLSAKTSPIRKLRDKIPVEDQLPVSEAQLIADADRVAPDYKPPHTIITTMKKED